MKKTLRDIVVEILDYMDGQPVSSINDTDEALQIARIVERTYYNLMSSNTVPEQKKLLKLIVSSDATYPTHLKTPDDLIRLHNLWYDIETDPTKKRKYHELQYVDPLTFIHKTDTYEGQVQIVPDKDAATDLRIRTDKHPDFYTSFNDNWIVVDSFNSSVDSTLQANKLRAYGTVLPQFTIDDDFIPEMDVNLFPVLIEEAKSVAFEVLKGVRSTKVEQAARRNRYLSQPDRQKVGSSPRWNNYGRVL